MIPNRWVTVLAQGLCRWDRIYTHASFLLLFFSGLQMMSRLTLLLPPCEGDPLPFVSQTTLQIQGRASDPDKAPSCAVGRKRGMAAGRRGWQEAVTRSLPVWLCPGHRCWCGASQHCKWAVPSLPATGCWEQVHARGPQAETWGPGRDPHRAGCGWVAGRGTDKCRRVTQSSREDPSSLSHSLPALGA